MRYIILRRMQHKGLVRDLVLETLAVFAVRSDYQVSKL